MPSGRGRGRLPGWRGWLAFGTVILTLLIMISLASLQAARAFESSVATDLQLAQVDLRSGLTHLEDGYRSQDAAKVEASFTRFQAPQQRLLTLTRRTRPLRTDWPMAPAWLRSRVVTLDAVIDMATHLNRAGISGAQALLSSGMVRGSGAGGQVEVARLTELLTSLRQELSASYSAHRSRCGFFS